VNLQFKQLSVNLGRVYAEVDDDKWIDITGALVNPEAAIDVLLADYKMRQIAERNARLREFADECREDAIRGARI
jgi:hypothetical protein